jgi:hypothetical protein
MKPWSAAEKRELVDVLEIAIDRGEADVGHLVELLQLAHDQFADFLRSQFALAKASSFSSMRRSPPRRPRWPPAACAAPADAGRQLVAVEFDTRRSS